MNKKPLYDRDRLSFETHAVLTFARASACVHGNHSVTSDKLFFGILHMPNTDAARALKQCGITLEQCAGRRQVIPLTNIEGEFPYTAHVEDILRRSIVRAEEEGRKYALPSDLLLTLLESMRGGDEEKDDIFSSHADEIKMALKTIQQENQIRVAGMTRA